MTDARQYEQNLVCFQTLGRAQPASLKTYRETGGYEVWGKVLAGGMTREQVLMTLGQPDSTEPAGRLGGQFWFWHFQNIQCQWFQLHVGADGRTTGTGAPTMFPGCDAPS